jgi:O-antigen ligase
LIFLYYIYEVAVYGGEVKSNKELWNSSGYMFRYTMGKVYSFQGFSINPNVSILPFLVSFLISEAKGRSKGNRALLSFIYVLFLIIVAISTNSRGAVAMVILVLSLFMLMRYSSKIFSIFSVSFALIVLMFIGLGVVDENYFLESNYFENLSNKIEVSTDSKRLEKISNGIEIFKENPLFGGGFSSVKEEYDMSVENGYVEFLAVFGGIGVIMLFLILVVRFYSQHRYLNKEIVWSLAITYLLINVFNTGYMYPVNSLILGLSFMCFNPKDRNKSIIVNERLLKNNI